MNLSLYERVSELHGALPWSSVLDAGTGPGSMRWLLSLPTERWTAVTGSPRMSDVVRKEAGDRIRADDRLIVGNWLEPELLAGEVYDVVLADYLLGAVDGFAPYWQDRLFPRLRPHVGRRLYVIGLEPYIAHVPTDPAGRLVNEIGRLRDACLLLGGDRPYREYPLHWVLRHLELAGFRVIDTQRISVKYGERFVNSQLDICAQVLERLRNRALAVTLQPETCPPDFADRAVASAVDLLTDKPLEVIPEGNAGVLDQDANSYLYQYIPNIGIGAATVREELGPRPPSRWSSAEEALPTRCRAG